MQRPATWACYVCSCCFCIQVAAWACHLSHVGHCNASKCWPLCEVSSSGLYESQQKDPPFRSLMCKLALVCCNNPNCGCAEHLRREWAIKLQSVIWLLWRCLCCGNNKLCVKCVGVHPQLLSFDACSHSRGNKDVVPVQVIKNLGDWHALSMLRVVAQFGCTVCVLVTWFVRSRDVVLKERNTGCSLCLFNLVLVLRMCINMLTWWSLWCFMLCLPCLYVRYCMFM